MKKVFYLIVYIISLAIISFSQTPTPTLRPANDENDIVRISTNLIQIDVTLTDSNGNVINNINPEEIEVYENGKK
jgi:hypothetical protein